MAAEPSLCPDCIKGVRHEGTPTGNVEKIAGVDVYIAIPPGDYEKCKALLYLPDALGLPLWNAQLLADDFALNGIQVYLIDYFDGDPVPLSVFEDKEAWSKFDIPGWVRKHPETVVRPRLDPVIAALKERGITQFAATGYCFGGKYVFNLAQENVIEVGTVSHPSLLQLPGDFETLIQKSKAPILINSCDVDQQFPKEACGMADKLLGDQKYKPGYRRVHWPGCVHGFAVKGNLNNPNVKAGKEGAFKESAAWIKKYL